MPEPSRREGGRGRRRATEFLNPLVTLGIVFLIGLGADLAARRLHLPRVTLLVLAGFAVGPGGFGLIPGLAADWLDWVVRLALSMVGFLVGSSLTREGLAGHGRSVLIISLLVTAATAVLVGFGMLVMAPLAVALLLAGIATATAPAAVKDVIDESNAKGPFARLLLGVIALDDAWGILTFSVLLAGAAALGGAEPWSAFGQGAWEVFGAVLLGIAAGLPMAYLTGRLNPGRPTLAEALGFVALVAGAAVWMGASALLAAVVLGVVVANLAQHHDRPVHAIEGVEWPFLIVFFLLAGAELRLGQVAAVAPLIVAYVLLRVSGRLAGGWAGVRLSGERPNFRPWMGPALLPQAGVGLGLALLAAPRFPELGSMLLSIVVGSTVLFELAGPLATRWALRRVGETPS